MFKSHIEYVDVDLSVFNDAENKNFRSMLSFFKDEVFFFKRLSALFVASNKKVGDEYIVIIELFQLCNHNLAFSFLNILRGHFKEPCIISRNSIEAVAQATIIKENLRFNNETWCRGEKGKENIKAFKELFKKDKFRNCKNKDELKVFFRMFSSFGHSNILNGIHRTKKEGDKLLFGFFDVEVDNLEAWMVRYLNYIIVVYSIILEEFSDIFRDFGIASPDDVKKLREEHRVYMETRRGLLSQFGKYDFVEEYEDVNKKEG